jgi:hypothetical protein
MTSGADKGRLRPDGRAAKPRRMREGENDRTIVTYLYHYGVLSQTQFERILERSRSTVQQLLRRLYDHHYVERLFLPVTKFGSSPALYVLDREGIALLRSMGIEEFSGIPGKDLKPMFLYHTVAISEVHLAFEKACKRSGYSMGNWLNDNRLRSEGTKVRIASQRNPVTLIPDSYFTITVPNLGTTHCFLELDRGTMDSGDFKKKVEAYVAGYKSGEFNRRYGAQGYRVLTVVDGVGEARVTNLANATANIPSIGRRFWFTHMKRLSPETVLSDPIWQIAGSNDFVPLVSR